MPIVSFHIITFAEFKNVFYNTLWKILIEQKRKVFILDADVNTPSMPVIFPEANPNKYLMVDSLGYQNKSTIYIK